MKRRIPDRIFIVITLLAVTGFQAYWLKDNYDREKRTLQIKANVEFQETVRQLQTAKLKLPVAFDNDSTHKTKRRIFVDEGIQKINVDGKFRKGEIITMVNAMRDKFNDTVKHNGKINSTLVISVGNGSQMKVRDTMLESSPITFSRHLDSSNHVFNMLYRVDSLQDTLKIPEIVNKLSASLKKEQLDVPFTINKLNGNSDDEEQELSDVTVGFAHPITYHLSLGNTFPYLVKKLTLPILFSVFLVGVTILSFVLLYRNLLRQQRLAEIKNEFISNMTHELKTPIATVGVAIEALKNFNAMHDPEKTKEYLDISGNELQRLSLLVDKVLKLSMFEKKQIELNKEHFDVKELTQEVLDSMRLQFEKNNAVINFTTVGNNFMINADKLHITSVIYNFLDNALKYSKENSLIDVRLCLRENNLEIKIADNGIGIAEEYRKKIFDKFFRVPTGNKHSVKGYGLGLSYVSEIISRHQGTINVDSELDKGSTFTVKLPV